MSTLCSVYTQGCCRCWQCCSVVSVECCMFSVYISHIPQYLHIYRFTHCWLTLCSPVQTVGRMQPRKQTITRLHTLLSSSLPFIFWTDFTKPVPAENATYCDAPHTSHSKPDRIIMSHTTQNINLMPQFTSESLVQLLSVATFLMRSKMGA